MYESIGGVAPKRRMVLIFSISLSFGMTNSFNDAERETSLILEPYSAEASKETIDGKLRVLIRQS